ncbi:hypothetical protein FCM35_KLT00776 [Carex littledalei]|uniref:Uncharacterized protein n=1 Tax=Carex littledalei TaxID=544730 RepID=A0A833RLN5_9POAL|nr:hypothetical protein FCM35_KLT00776 [Carex littledalei]
MKNVSEMRYWCELQNPVTHRVFERKLRPRDPPEGTPASRALEAHPRSVCLRANRCGHWPSEPRGAVAQVCGRRAWPGARVVGYCARRPELRTDTGPCLRPPNEEHAAAACAARRLRTDTPGQRGYPPSLSI